MSTFRTFSVVGILFLFPQAASAATLSFQAEPARIGVGDTVLVTLRLTSNQPVNAFSGTLRYSGAILVPQAVSDGNSFVNMWITRPTIREPGAPLTFAGITPGGFSGVNGVLFSVVFKASAAGTARVFLDDVDILRNDGAGSREPTDATPLTLSIGASSAGGYLEPADDIPPEPFIVYEGNDPSLFEGRAYLVFAAADKGSGISHYEVAESRIPRFLHSFFPPAWKEAASPYEIADRRLTDAIYVKAVDRAENERLAVFPPQRLFTAYEILAFLVILIATALLFQRIGGRRFGTHA